MKEFLERLLQSLNEIEVKGKANIDILLGCMMAIERAIAQTEETKEGQESNG
jgi:hypothetical protein